MSKNVLPKDLAKHAREFKGALSAHAYEQTGDGIYFPSQKVVVAGAYTHNVNGLDERTDPNLVMPEGLNYMLKAALSAGPVEYMWYLALFTGNVAPQASWTAANFSTNATEVVSRTNGYSEEDRPQFVADEPAAGAITNATQKAAFSIVTTGTALSAYGGALLSASPRGGQTGVLMSAARFAAPRNLENGDMFNLGYTLTLQSA